MLSSKPCVSDPRAAGFLDAAAGELADGSRLLMGEARCHRGGRPGGGRWGRGGRVNSLAPGLIDTPMGRQEAEQQPMMKLMLEKTPLERLGDAARWRPSSRSFSPTTLRSFGN